MDRGTDQCLSFLHLGFLLDEHTHTEFNKKKKKIKVKVKKQYFNVIGKYKGKLLWSVF